MAKVIAKVATTLLKDLVSMERTFHNVQKNKAIRDEYSRGDVPKSTPDFKAGFDTPCSNEPANLEAPWQFAFNTCTVTVATDEDTTFYEVKEAMFHARHAAYAAMDVQVGLAHIKMLKRTTSYAAFEDSCFAVGGNPESADDHNREEISPLDELDLGAAATLLAEV